MTANTNAHPSALSALKNATHNQSTMPQREGFSLVECTVSVMLVGILMTAALRGLGASHVRTSETLMRLEARQLCDSLCREILSKEFSEPSFSGATLGLDAAENQTLRTSLDDVDDYLNLNVSPPTDQRGIALAGFSNWRVVVAVSWADPSTLAATAVSNTNLKRIEVQAYHSNQLIMSTLGYRAP